MLQQHQQPGLHGTQGFEGFLSSKEQLRKRAKSNVKPDDRLFSLSSKTSPVVS